MNMSWSISEATQIQIATYFLPFYIVNTLVSTLCNTMIILVTVRCKELRSVSNILIAVQAAGDMITTWDIPLWASITLRHRFISVTRCLLYQLVPTLSLNITLVTMLLIGLDRLLIVVRPQWYASLNKKRYLLVLMMLNLAYCLPMTLGLYLSSTEDQVLCFITDPMTGYGRHAWAVSQSTISIAVIIVYNKAKNALKAQTVLKDSNSRKIFRSIYLVMVFYICGWSTSGVLFIAARVLIRDARLSQVVDMSLCFFAAINLCAPFFVYYSRSPIYRREFRRLLFLDSGEEQTWATCSTPNTKR